MYATYILDLKVDCKNEMELFIGPIIDMTPSYPTSMIVFHISTWPGISIFLIMN
jgi:hypothetical protein